MEPDGDDGLMQALLPEEAASLAADHHELTADGAWSQADISLRATLHEMPASKGGYGHAEQPEAPGDTVSPAASEQAVLVHEDELYTP
jgi:hypothetical protein